MTNSGTLGCVLRLDVVPYCSGIWSSRDGFSLHSKDLQNDWSASHQTFDDPMLQYPVHTCYTATDYVMYPMFGTIELQAVVFPPRSYPSPRVRTYGVKRAKLGTVRKPGRKSRRGRSFHRYRPRRARPASISRPSGLRHSDLFILGGGAAP